MIDRGEKMKKQLFWKNFNMGKELSIAGSFIYNGLRAFDLMKTFYYEEEIFEVLYNISVGIERLEKIAIVLLEHDKTDEQIEFESSLRTHNHQELYNRISRNKKCNFSNVHNAFLQLLSNFYNSMRYDRYTLLSVYDYGKERKALVEFIKKYLDIKIEITPPFNVTCNNSKIKRFIGKVVGKICNQLYDIIYEESTRLKIYTHEIDPWSKASKIFLRKKYDFCDEDIVWKELFLFIMNTPEYSDVIDLIRDIEPLNLEECRAGEYFDSLKSTKDLLMFIDEIESYYEDINIKERLSTLGILDDMQNIIFDGE
jgi:hypothetical protein